MPILETYEAIAFRKPMQRGLTKPFLVTGRHLETGEEIELVVKPRAGYANRQDAIFKEIFSTLLARELGVLTPVPVIVEIPKGLEFGAEDYPDSKAMIEQSYGLNYTTVFLGNDWKTWTKGANPRGIDQEMIQSTFCLDALLQNMDRRQDNPNLLWKGDQLVTLDFDKAFAYRGRPMKEFMPMLGVKDHVLHPYLKALAESELIGTELWEAWEEWTLANSPDTLIEGDANMPPLKNIDDADLSSVLDYLKTFSQDPEKFFQYLTEYSK